MSKTVRVAIAGVGNCASSLVQGVEYYRDAAADDQVPGLMIASATRSASSGSTRSKVVSRRTPSIRSIGRDPTFRWMSDARCSTACRRSWSRSSMGLLHWTFSDLSAPCSGC